MTPLMALNSIELRSLEDDVEHADEETESGMYEGSSFLEKWLIIQLT